MFSPDAVVVAAAGVVVVTSTAFNFAAARSIRRAADALLLTARLRAGRPDRPNVPLPPRRPDWARDTTQAMPLIPPPAGGLRGPKEG